MINKEFYKLEDKYIPCHVTTSNNNYPFMNGYIVDEDEETIALVNSNIYLILFKNSITSISFQRGSIMAQEETINSLIQKHKSELK